MKKILLVLLVLFMVCGCSNNSTNDVPVTDDNGTDEVIDNNDFDTTIDPNLFFDVVKAGVDASKSVEEIADDLCNATDIFSLVSMPVEPGYLNGFSNEVFGFEKGMVISPMIGSIPFIMYVMETEDTKNMEAIIGDNMDMRWNICTEATDSFIESYQNTVFFMMYSNAE